LNYTFDSNK